MWAINKNNMGQTTIISRVLQGIGIKTPPLDLAVQYQKSVAP